MGKNIEQGLCYEQPHNISLPSREYVELNPVQEDRFREKQHGRQKYLSRKKLKRGTEYEERY